MCVNVANMFLIFSKMSGFSCDGITRATHAPAKMKQGAKCIGAGPDLRETFEQHFCFFVFRQFAFRARCTCASVSRGRCPLRTLQTPKNNPLK